MAQGQSQQVERHLCRMLDQTQDDPATDRQLLERFLQQRDEDAFAVLIRRHGSLVMSVCRSLLRDGHDAEDVYQATWLVLARKLRAVAWRDSIAGWLYEVAHRLALKARTQSARHEARQEPLEEDPVAPDAPLSDEARWLHDEVARLPEKYRSPLVLCYLEGKTSAEAARVLNKPPGSMSKLLARGLEMLRTRLRSRGHGMSLAALGTSLTQLGQATVPAGWCETITPAAVALAGGKAALATLASGPVVSLVQGVVGDMTLQQFKFVAVVALVLLLGGAGLSALSLRSAWAQPTRPPVEKIQPSEKGGTQPGENKLPPTPARQLKTDQLWNVYQIVDGQTHPRKLGTTAPNFFGNPIGGGINKGMIGPIGGPGFKAPPPQVVQIPANAVWYVQPMGFGFGFGGGFNVAGGFAGVQGGPLPGAIGAAGALGGPPPAGAVGVGGAFGVMGNPGTPPANPPIKQPGNPGAPPPANPPAGGGAGLLGGAGQQGLAQQGHFGNFGNMGQLGQFGAAGAVGFNGGLQFGAVGALGQLGQLGNLGGMPGFGLIGGKLTGKELQTLLAEMKKQQVPGLRLENIELSDDDLATVVKELPNLQVLLLFNTKTTDAGVKHLAGLKNLRVLGLEGASFTDKALEELTKLPAPLDTLRIGGSKITNNGFSAVGELKALRVLRVTWSSIDKTGLAALAKLDTLEAIEIIGESTDEDIAALKGAANLKAVRLHFSKLGAKGIEALAKVEKLEHVTLDWMWGEDGPQFLGFGAGLIGVGGGFGVGGGAIGVGGGIGGPGAPAPGAPAPGGPAGAGALGGPPGAGAFGVGGGALGVGGGPGLGVLGVGQQGNIHLPTNPVTILPDGTPKEKPKPAVVANDLKGLASIKGLTTLYLMGDSFGDPEAESIKGCTTLKKLELFAPALTDAGVGHLKELKALERLNVCFSKITPASGPNLRGLPNLKTVYVPVLPIDPGSKKTLLQFQQALPRCTVYSLTSMPGYEALAPLFAGLP
jgi:RNA polymerase sigma factor (sigma-70 family)